MEKKTELEKLKESYTKALERKLDTYPVYDTNPFIPNESKKMNRVSVQVFKESYYNLKGIKGLKISLKEYAIFEQTEDPFWFHKLFGYTLEELQLLVTRFNEFQESKIDGNWPVREKISEKKFNSLGTDQKNEYFEWLKSLDSDL